MGWNIKHVYRQISLEFLVKEGYCVSIFNKVQPLRMLECIFILFLCTFTMKRILFGDFFFIFALFSKDKNTNIFSYEKFLLIENWVNLFRFLQTKQNKELLKHIFVKTVYIYFYQIKNSFVFTGLLNFVSNNIGTRYQTTWPSLLNNDITKVREQNGIIKLKN